MKNKIAKIPALLAASCMAMLSMNSCNKLAANLSYDLNMQTASVNFTIPPCSNTSIALSGTETNYYNIDSFIKANTLGTMGVSNISSVKITSCSIALNNATSANNFANFSTCTGGFYTDGDNTPYSVTIANNPDVYSAVLNLPVDTSAELKGYLSNSKIFTYTLSGALRRPTTDSVHCTATFYFKIHVKGI